MNKSIKITGFVFLFLFSFLFFVWSTFPYEVLKETISNQLSEATGMSIRIGDLGPRFPVGIRFGDIVVASGNTASLEIKQISATISPFALLIGRVSVTVELVAPKGDPLEVQASLGLLSLLRGAAPLPKSIVIKSKGLPLGRYINFLLVSEANSATANPLIAPLLKQIEFDAKLLADIDIDLNTDDPTDSSGKVSVILKDAVLKITEPSLNIPDQAFETAKIEGQLSKAVFALKDGSGLISGDLSIVLGGNVTLKQPIDRSAIAAAIQIEVRGPLKENFGFIMDAASGAQTEGKISMKIDGTVGMPNFGTM
jgi:type II secretion system protein N